MKESNFIIELSHLSKSFGEKVVLDDVSLHVPAGKKIGIVGHTGSGKSSLMNLLLGYNDYQEGQLLVDGVDIKANDYMALVEKKITACIPDKVEACKRALRELITEDDEITWRPMKLNSMNNSTLSASNFVEYTYVPEIEIETEFNDFAIRIDMKSKNKVDVPRVKNLRAIAIV